MSLWDVVIRIALGLLTFGTGWDLGRRYMKRRRQANAAKRRSVAAWKEVERLAEELKRTRVSAANHLPDADR